VPRHTVIVLTAVVRACHTTVLELAEPGAAPNVITATLTHIAGHSWRSRDHDPLSAHRRRVLLKLAMKNDTRARAAASFQYE
jgi:hypothetical protein